MAKLKKIDLLSSKIGGIENAVSSKNNSNLSTLNLLPISLLSIGVILFIFSIFLRVQIFYKQKGFNSIKMEQERIESEAKKIKSVRQAQEKLTDKLEQLANYLTRDIIWSEKLSQLSSLITPQVWLTQFSFEGKDTSAQQNSKVYFKGGLIPKDDTSAIGTLSSFINELKQSKDFFADFSGLILVDFQTVTKDDFEILTFAIEMPLRK